MAVSPPKRDSDDEPPIPEELRRKIEMDDPGIDLSVFKPLGKRKCVLELEERKGKTWYEADDDASEEEAQEEDCKFIRIFDIFLLILLHMFTNPLHGTNS